MAAAKLLSERDVRRMLELAAQVGRADRAERWAFFLEKLKGMVEADAGLVLQVRRRGRSNARFDMIVSHGSAEPIGVELRGSGERPQYAQSYVPLETAGHYSCVRVYRAAGFTPQQVEMVDFVWQALGELHAA